jgi:RimJ/RimL family protein N-acetyltransferase
LAVVLDDELAPDWSERCRQLVDGRGAERVCSLLMLNAETPLQARLARLDDEDLILQLANDPLVRQSAFSTSTVDPVNHRTWFRKRLRDLENCRIYVVETAEGLPIGQVRFERAGDAWEIDYALDPRARGRALGKPLIQCAMLALRTSMDDALLLGRVRDANRASRRVFEALDFECEETVGGGLSIAVCSDAASWINDSIPELVLGWVAQGHRVVWAYNADQLPCGALCFYLSYGRIVDAAILGRYRHNLVVHESDLPKGRGWSPMSWQIIEGAQRIPVTLLEAVDEVDAGPIYLQDWIELEGHELSSDWRALQAAATIRLCRRFVQRYPGVLSEASEQIGGPTFYRKRRPKDSELNPSESLAAQFNLLRAVDNIRYPAFFDINGERFVLRIDRHR